MKLRSFIFVLIALAIISQPILSQNFLEQVEKVGYEKVEANLLEGMKTDNCGLKISCAYFLGELKSKKAVIPLMEMLRCHENNDARIIAALSLIKIEDNAGVFMVKREAQFNDSERIRAKCDHFYKAFVMKKYEENNYSLAGSFNPTSVVIN